MCACSRECLAVSLHAFCHSLDHNELTRLPEGLSHSHDLMQLHANFNKSVGVARAVMFRAGAGARARAQAGVRAEV